MQLLRWMSKMVTFLVTILGIWTVPGCTQKQEPIPGVHESRYATPFSLRQSGEHIDLLVRVKDSERGHQFNLALVEPRDWPDEKKDVLRRLADGRADSDDIYARSAPYPLRLRIRIDAVDEGNDVHIDQIVANRSPLYMRYADNGTNIWRVQNIYRQVFQPGIYRVRLENLVPLPQFDFETLFIFERDNRKY